MFWRKFKLDWTYAIGELVIVTLGVLVALGIQQWNEDRLERLEEIEILGRLLFDLNTDLTYLQDQLSAAEVKEKSLDRLEASFASGVSPTAPKQFLTDIVAGAYYGWAQSSARTRTFDEILASDKFGLIRDTELRGVIADYYGAYSTLLVRSDARETPYPHISYRLVPRSRKPHHQPALLDADSSDETDEYLERLVQSVLESEIRDYIIAERNLARFLVRESGNLHEGNRTLVMQIQDYLGSLEN